MEGIVKCILPDLWTLWNTRICYCPAHQVANSCTCSRYRRLQLCSNSDNLHTTFSLTIPSTLMAHKYLVTSSSVSAAPGVANISKLSSTNTMVYNLGILGSAIKLWTIYRWWSWQDCFALYILPFNSTWGLQFCQYLDKSSHTLTKKKRTKFTNRKV